MSIYNLVWYTSTRKSMFFNEITHLDIRPTPQIEWYERLPYLFNVNYMENVTFQYDPENKLIYVDQTNHQKHLEQEEATAELAKQMEAEGKTEAEIKEAIKWTWETFIDRQEYILTYGDVKNPSNLADVVSDTIKTLSN